MNLQYISDARGRHTAVVIPIEDWNNITAQYEELKELELEKPTKKPSDFRGAISKETAELMLQHAEQARNEWESGIS